MKRVIIIGSPGAGKSTFARELAKKTRLPLHYLDMIWHRPDRTTLTRDEFDTKLDKILSEDEWIIDGNYQRTITERLEKCDTVCLLDYPAEVCLSGAEARLGAVREDMPWAEERVDEEFKAFILNFKETTLPAIYKLLSEHSDKDIHIFKSREDAEIFLNKYSPV